MKTFFTVCVILLFFSCKVEEEALPATDAFNAIPNTGSIRIPAYSYLPAGAAPVNVKGDAGANQFKEEYGADPPVLIPVIDTLTADFEVQWTPVPSRFIAAGIFRKIPATSNPDKNSINNTADCVWMWNNAMGTGNNGAIRYTDGRSVDAIVNGNPVYENALQPLQPGVVYYFMLWAWNEDATKIIYSSRVIRILIKI
jgi:hypothetical protein